MPPKNIIRGAATAGASGNTNLQILSEEVVRERAEAVAAAVREAGDLDSGIVLFVSSRDEVDLFDIAVGVEEHEIVRGLWDRNGERVVWRVPVKLVDQFSRHTFVQQGRVLKAE
jgi:hypothetical protein